MKQITDEERARKILDAMKRLEKRKSVPRLISWIPWIILLAIVAAIVVVLLTSREQFLQIWNHVIHPDSLPGM